MKPILSPNIKMNLSMEHCVQAMALEAGAMESVLGAIKKYLPGLSTGFADKMKEFQASTATTNVELPKEIKRPVEVLRSMKYFDLEKTPVMVHEGFNGHLLQVIPVLRAMTDHISFVNNLTNEYKGFLAAIISNKDSRISLATHQALYSKSNGQIDTLSKAINEFYIAGSTTAESTFGELFARNSDAEKFLQEMYEVRRHFDKAPIATVRQNVGLCSEYLRLFIESVENGDVDNVSNEVIQDLSLGAYQIAKEAEFIAMNIFRINAFISTANDLINSLNKLNQS